MGPPPPLSPELGQREPAHTLSSIRETEVQMCVNPGLPVGEGQNRGLSHPSPRDLSHGGNRLFGRLGRCLIPAPALGFSIKGTEGTPRALPPPCTSSAGLEPLGGGKGRCPQGGSRKGPTFTAETPEAGPGSDRGPQERRDSQQSPDSSARNSRLRQIIPDCLQCHGDASGPRAGEEPRPLPAPPGVRRDPGAAPAPRCLALHRG